MPNLALCPFSTPIAGRWCDCEYSTMHERCSGKMSCKHSETLLPECIQLFRCLKENARFALSIKADAVALTHTQAIKLCCGGLIGMQRIIFRNNAVPNVRKVINTAIKHYSELSLFPYNEIIGDIQHFNYRKKQDREV